MNLRRQIAVSKHPVARSIRRVRHGVINLSLPAPRCLVVPWLWGYLAARTIYYFLLRVFICEPLFKAYCTRYGRGVRTGVYIHWIQGSGEIILGDDVTLDGKSSISFSAWYGSSPKLIIGSNTYVGHDCVFSVGKSIKIGSHCLIASGAKFFEFSGHPTDPEARRANLPPPTEKIRPIEIGDNAWIGTNSMIMSGVRIGEGSIVAAGSVVRSSVAEYTIVAGNPAIQVAVLKRPVPERSEPG